MRRKSVVTILLALLASMALSASDRDSDRMRPHFFQGKLSVSPVPLVGQQARISLELTAVADDCEGATIQFRTPAGIALSGRGVFQDQYLTKGSSHRYFADIEVLDEGSYALQATIYFQLWDGRPRAEHFFTYLLVGNTDSQARDDAPFPMERRTSQMKMLAPAAAHRAADSSANVRGYVMYYDDNLTREAPIRRIKVELLEEIRFVSWQVDSTYTDDEGFYSFENVTTADLQGETGRDIWLRASFENDTVRIMDAEDVLYKFESFVTYKARDGHTNTDLYLNNQNQYRGLGHIFNSIMDVHDFLQRSVGWHRKGITVCWPYGESSKYKYEYFLLDGTIYREYIYIPAGREWNRTTMLHEYGHSVMMALYGYNFRNYPQDSFEGNHWLYTVSDLGFAMKEGWAELFEALIDDDAYNVTAYYNADSTNIESNDWWTGDIEGRGSNTRGEIVEGAVASILWDIADTDQSHDRSPGMDDDDMDGMFEEIWELMLNYRPVNILEFWDHWTESNYGRTGALYSIYRDHGVNVALPSDVNSDGAIDFLDLMVIGHYFGQKVSGSAQPNPDVNRDGEVNILDIVIWARNF